MREIFRKKGCRKLRGPDNKDNDIFPSRRGSELIPEAIISNIGREPGGNLALFIAIQKCGRALKRLRISVVHRGNIKAVRGIPLPLIICFDSLH